MKNRMIAMVVLALGTFWASTSEGQALREVFKHVNFSVVVVRTIDVIAAPKSQMIISSAQGSGVLISTDGEVITAKAISWV